MSAGLIAFLIIGTAIYFIPSFIATTREHHQALAIFMLNLLLGWTALGWIVAMIWACTATPGSSAPARSVPTPSSPLAGEGVFRPLNEPPRQRTGGPMLAFLSIGGGLIVIFAIAGLAGNRTNQTAGSASEPVAVSPREACLAKGERYFRDIGSWPYLSSGESAEQAVKRRCGASLAAFG